MPRPLINHALSAIGGGVAVFLAFGLYQALLAPPRILELTTDDSRWAKAFTAATDIPVLRVTTAYRNRTHADRFAVVGKRRSADWFTKLGYEIQETRVAPEWEASHSGVFFERGERVQTIAMTHADHRFDFFSYLPATGILIAPVSDTAD